LKTIQIIDGADNAAFSLFRATDEEFAYLFPKPGQDLEIIEDVLARHHPDFIERMMADLWSRPIHKSKANGVHGTLFYDYADKAHHLPASRREIDRNPLQINPATRELYARLATEDLAPESAPSAVTDPEWLEGIPGGKELVAWFEGYVPTFHDAEIVSLALDTGTERCVLRVAAFIMTPEVDAAGYFVLKAHVVVAFTLDGVTGLELDGFNHQNVIFGLSLVTTPVGGVRLEMEHCHGLAGWIEAGTVAIALEPGKPG